MSTKKGFINSMLFPTRLLFILFTIVLCACSTTPRITTITELSASADAPYQNVLVIALFSSFDTRRYLEDEVVSQLSGFGIDAVASTSMMDTRTPVIRETFVEMVRDIDADAVLLTQLVSLRSVGTMVDMNPESTINLRPTGYWNVFSVETTEYVEPQAVDFEHSLVLKTDIFSVESEDIVWGIESRSTIDTGFDQARDYRVIVNEARAIVSSLASDGVIAP